MIMTGGAPARLFSGRMDESADDHILQFATHHRRSPPPQTCSKLLGLRGLPFNLSSQIQKFRFKAPEAKIIPISGVQEIGQPP